MLGLLVFLQPLVLYADQPTRLTGSLVVGKANFAVFTLYKQKYVACFSLPDKAKLAGDITIDLINTSQLPRLILTQQTRSVTVEFQPSTPRHESFGEVTMAISASKPELDFGRVVNYTILNFGDTCR